MKDYSIVGKSTPRTDAVSKVTGKAIYTDDVKMAGMLTGKLLRSPFPHAKILNIDTSKATKLRGVKAVITGKDTGSLKMGTSVATRDILWDQTSLCIDKVRYIGDEVAAVAATDEDTAMEALELIKVDYKELPAVFDMYEAMEPDAPIIHEGFEKNISNQVLLKAGDVEQALKDSYKVYESRYESHCHAHCAMEPHTSLGSWDNNGRITLWTSTQAPYQIRTVLAFVLGLPEDRVRVIVPALGGGFGGKVELMPMDVCCALLSKKTGYPVKITLTREEEFGTSRVSHPITVEIKTAVTKDGIILAKKIRNIMDGGAYGAGGAGGAGPFLSTLFLRLDYKVPNLSLNALRVYTNKTIAGARRGYTAPQVRFAECSHLDEIAEDLGMDPVEFRLKNAIGPNYTSSTGIKVTSCGFPEAIEKTANCIGWKDIRGKQKEKAVGVGMGGGGSVSGSSYAPDITPMNYTTSVMIKLHKEGFATLYTGATDCGQGSGTVLPMIAAEELGISMDKIMLMVSDTDLCPYDAGTWGQRVTFHAGNASRLAAADAKKQLFEVVAKKLEANIKDLEAKDNRIYVKGTPEKGMTFRQAIWICQEDNNGQEIIGRGHFRHDEKPEVLGQIYATGFGNYCAAYVFCAGAAKVKIDKETGQIDVSRFCFAQDCGTAINPVGVEGQLEGGLHMGLGYSLMENIKTENGSIMNASYIDYKFPTVYEMPEMDIILIEPDEKLGPFGAKACGEGSLAPVAPAIANAIYDAIGVRIKNLPLTPEKILKALEEQEKSANKQMLDCKDINK
ncbi:MAG: xanthine dehydrogenase family protein molybdopterin-binding subunit [Pseudomonadota bacterium]